MRRLFGIAGALLLAYVIFIPAAVAADPELPHTGRVLMAVNGDVTLPAGEQADAVVVIHGTATVLGQVTTIVVVDGTAQLTGARAETLVAVRSPVSLGTGTVITGDVLTMDALVTKYGNAQVGGRVRSLTAEFTSVGWVLAPMVLMWLVGLAIAGIGLALLLAAIGSRQVRAAGNLISHQPVLTGVVGFAGIFLPLIVAIPAIVTIVGAPLGLVILLGLWPLAALLGYLVAAIWVGEIVVRSLTPAITRERPYLAAVAGVILLQVCSIFPPLVMLASLFGYGAVLLLAWESFRGMPAVGQPKPVGRAAPMAPAGPSAPTPVAG